jgi:hypothetical protein
MDSCNGGIDYGLLLVVITRVEYVVEPAFVGLGRCLLS